MTRVISDTKEKCFKTQATANIQDTTLVQNAWKTYSADLSAGKIAKVWVIKLTQTNNDATAETVELEITFNNVVTLWTLTNIASADSIYCSMMPNTSGTYTTYYNSAFQTVFSTGAAVGIPFQGLVGLIRYRQTSTVDGTSASIDIEIDWEKLVGVAQ